MAGAPGHLGSKRGVMALALAAAENAMMHSLGNHRVQGFGHHARKGSPFSQSRGSSSPKWQNGSQNTVTATVGTTPEFRLQLLGPAAPCAAFRPRHAWCVPPHDPGRAERKTLCTPGPVPCVKYEKLSHATPEPCCSTLRLRLVVAVERQDSHRWQRNTACARVRHPQVG